MLNVEVDRPKMIEVTAFGVALLAGMKAGIWTKNDIAQIREVDTIFSPKIDKKTRKKYYKGWKKAIKRTKRK
jgi:glycerol kinase